MSQIVNLTEYQAAPLVSTDREGRWQVTVTVKASYAWDETGAAIPINALPILLADEFAGEPASSGLLRASEVSQPKPKLDVLLAGAIVFARPIAEIDVELIVGTRLRKRARVFGDRIWQPGIAADLAPSRPRPVTRVPIAWERCYGGSDPVDAKRSDPRNPAGSGVVRDPKTLHGKPAPNFEDPRNLLPARLTRPAPIGFGPIAAHWQQRLALAGTYDEAWEKSRRPLCPEDFSPKYFNLAPLDQQLDGYVVGEEMRLVNLTTATRDRIRLPSLKVPVTVATSEVLDETTAVVDTVIIEPEERRLSLLARVQVVLDQGPMSLGRIVIGALTRATRKAVAKRKPCRWPARRGKVG